MADGSRAMSRRAEAWTIIQNLDPRRLLWQEWDDDDDNGCACPLVHVARGLGLAAQLASSPATRAARLVGQELNVSPNAARAFVRAYDNGCFVRYHRQGRMLSGQDMKEVAIQQWPLHIPITDDQPQED